jgi:hypothetical protein
MRALLIVLVACHHAEDVSATYPGGPPGAGSIDVALNDPSQKLTVAINDQLVVDRRFSRKAHIVGVPAGVAHVHVATGGGCEQRSLTEHDIVVPPGGSATILLPGPEPNTGCALLLGLFYVGLNVALVADAIILGHLAGGHAGHFK